LAMDSGSMRMRLIGYRFSFKQNDLDSFLKRLPPLPSWNGLRDRAYSFRQSAHLKI
jgi:hypothetical protein